MLTERPENHCADDSGCRCTRFELRECTQRALAPIMLKKKPRQPPTPSGEQLLAATASLTAPTRNTNWQSQPPSRDAGPWAALRSDRRSARRKPIERSSGADSMASQGSAKEKRRKLKLSASKTTVLDLIGITEKQDTADGTELLDDMRSNKFPRHRAHWLVMDPLQRWRLSWDVLMMLMICFVMIVTPFELAFVSAVGLKKNVVPFPNKYTGLFITNWTVNVLFIIDIVFNFLTAVYDAALNRWLLKFDAIALNYARGWMALDVVLMLPVEHLIESKQASAIRLLRVFRLMKLAKVLKSQELVNNISKHLDISTKLQTVVKYCVILVVIVHWTACALKLVTEYTLAECNHRGSEWDVDTGGWDAADGCPKTVLTETANYRDGIWAQYVEAAVWALVALNGEASTRTHGEGVLGLLVMLMGIIVMAFLIGDLSNIMSNLDPVSNEFKQTLDNLNDYMSKSGFKNDLRLKLREYIMLSEPCFRDHFNKEMLNKLSPTLISVVSRKKWGHVCEKILFYAHTVQRTHVFNNGTRVLVHARDRQEHDEEESAPRAGVVIRTPGLLRYDVQYDDGEVELRVRHTQIEDPPLPPDLLHRRRGEIQRLHFQRDLFITQVAHLFTTRLFMTFDVIIHKDLNVNDVMYVIEHGKVCCLNYGARKTFGIAVKQDEDYIGDDIAMLACGDRQKVLRHYSCHATAVTQMHALNAMDFCALLEREPALSLFYKHFRTWGCWQRLSRALTLNGARLVSMARLSADGAGNASLKAKLAALAATKTRTT